jgi:hypothetical protein
MLEFFFGFFNKGTFRKYLHLEQQKSPTNLAQGQQRWAIYQGKPT